MPYIPRTPDERVPVAPLPGYRPRSTATAENFGGGPAAEALAGQTVALARDRADQYLKDRQDALGIQENEIDTQLVVEANRRRLAIEAVKGKDAMAARDQSLAGYDDFYQKAVEKVTDAQLRQKLDQRYALRRTSLEAFATPYARQELDQYDTDQFKAKMQAHHDAGVLGYQDPLQVKLALSDQEQTLASQAQRKGWSPEMLAVELSNSESAMHREVVTRYLNTGQDLRAKEYFDAVKGQLTAEDLAALEKPLQVGSLRGESRRQADEILNSGYRVSDPATGQREFKEGAQTLDEALTQADTIKDTDLHDAVRDRLKRHWADKRLAEADARNSTIDQIAEIVEKTGSIDGVPPTLWASPFLKTSDRASFTARAADIRKGTGPQDNSELHYALKLSAADPASREKFTKTNLYIYRDQLSKSDYKDLEEMQIGLIKDDPKVTTKLDSWRTKADIINGTVGDKFGSGEKQDKEKREQFERAVDREMDSFRLNHPGKEPMRDDIEKIVDDLLTSKVEQHGWGPFDYLIPDKKAFTFEEKGAVVDEKRQILEKIGPEERRKIEDALRRRSLPVTDDEILRLYRAKLKAATNAK